MASIDKHRKGWRARVYVNGVRRSKTLPTKEHARQWAAAQEVELLNNHNGKLSPRPLSELFDRYAKEASPAKRGSSKEILRLAKFSASNLGKILTTDLTGQNIADWRDARLKEVSPSSVNREWNLLSAVFTRATKEWKWLLSNPASDAQRPREGDARTRRAEGDEVERILHCLGYDGYVSATAGQRTAIAVLFALETAMRSGEICALTWEHVHDRHVHIPRSKTGHARDVPLSVRARELMELLPRDGDLCFNLSDANRDAIYRKARDAAGVTGLRFHDLRREALSRLAKKLDVMTLAKMSGHRDLKTLMNVYYQPKVEEVADLLD